MIRYDDLLDDLKKFLLPHYIVPNKIVPRLALQFAGIKTSTIKPLSGSVSPCSSSKMFICIENITKDEATTLLNYFRAELDDREAWCDRPFQNLMETIPTFESFLFVVSIDKFAAHFVPRLKEYVSHTDRHYLYDYRVASAEDKDVIEYRKVEDLCTDLSCLEKQYKDQANIVSTLANTRVALQKYKRDDYRRYDICLKFYDMVFDNKILLQDKKLLDVRKRLFAHYDYDEPIPVLFNLATHKFEGAPLAKKICFRSKAKKVSAFFKAAKHRVKSNLPVPECCKRHGIR